MDQDTPNAATLLYYARDLTMDEAIDALKAARDVKKVKEQVGKLKSNIFDDSFWDWFLGPDAVTTTAPRAEDTGVRAVLLPICDGCDKPIERSGVLLQEPLRSLDNTNGLLTRQGQSAYHVACLTKILSEYGFEETRKQASSKSDDRSKR